MLCIKISIISGELLSVYIQNIAKLYSVILNKFEAENDWDNIESLENLMLSKLVEFQYSDHLEAQERVFFLINLVYFLKFFFLRLVIWLN